MQQNINPYDPDQFKKELQSTEIFRQLEKDYDFINFNCNFIATDDIVGTPRQWYADRNRKTIFSAVPFYYIEYLTKNYHGDIYDIGCGWNIFKKYIPNLVGVDKIALNPNSPWLPDIEAYFNDSFQEQYRGKLDRIMSINALHFVPFCQLRQRVLDFLSLLKPNGIAYLSLNLMRMIEIDPILVKKDQKDLENIIRQELHDIDYEYLAFEVDLTVFDNFMDGNIRLVAQNSKCI